MTKTLKEKQFDWVCDFQDTGNQPALMSLINSMEGLIRSCIKRCAWSKVDHDDLFSAGVQGVIEAATKFDRNRPGAMISAACAAHIKNRVFECAQKSGTPVSFSSNTKEKRIQRSAERLMSSYVEAGLSHAQALEATARDLDADPKHVTAVLASRRPVHNDDDKIHIALVSTEESPADLLDSARLPEFIEQCMEEAGLTERELFCVRKRFLSEEGAILEDIAAEYGFSRERARQVCNFGIEKLAAHIKKKGLVFSDFF